MTPRIIVLSEKLTVSELVKKVPFLGDNGKFSIVFRESIFLTIMLKLNMAYTRKPCFFFTHLYLTQGGNVNMAPFFLGHLVL